MPRAFEQPMPDLLLQLLHTGAERGLGHMQAAGGFVKAFFLRNGDEVTQLTQFHRDNLKRSP
jgi:hypothetical protein